MSLPRNRLDFADWVLRKLGAPVLEINVDEDQVEDRIDEALSFFQEFHNDAVQTVYLKHQLTQEDIDDASIPVSDLVYGVNQIFLPQSPNGLFSADFNIRMQGLNEIRSSSLITLYQVQTYLQFIENMFRGNVPFRFSRHSRRIEFLADFRYMNPGDYILVEATRFLDPDVYDEIFTNRMFLKLAAAYVQQQWGMNMKKFQGMSLPGGVEINGQQLYDEATQEIQRLEEEIRNTYEVPPAFFVG